MVYSLQLLIPFAAVNRRNTAITELQNQITTRPRWGAESIEAITSKAGDPAVFADLRFTSEGDNDSLEVWLRNQLTGVNTPRDGASIQIHRCRHDESAILATCVPLRRFEVISGVWQRII